jgi:hypothetical protein
MIAAILEWWRNEDLATRLAFLGIVLAGGIARLAALSQPMRYDESIGYLYFVGRPWATAITAYPSPSNHVLYTVIAKLAAPLGHGAPWALRLPAFVAGVVIIPLTFAVGRVLFTRTAALIGAALTAASTPLVLYSANARGYAFVAAAYLILLLIAARIRKAGTSCCAWVAFAIVAAAGAVAIPVMLYPVGAVALWLTFVLLAERGWRAWKPLAGLAASLLGAAALASLAYLPIIATNGIRAITANQFVAPTAWPQFFDQFASSAARVADVWSQPYPGAVGMLLGVIGLAGVIGSTGVSNEGVSVVLAGYVWCAFLLLVTHHAPFARAWLWLLPVAALAAGTVWDRLVSRARWRVLAPYLPAVAAAVAALGVAWGFSVDAVSAMRPSGMFVGAERIAQALATQSQLGDRVIASAPSAAALRYYMLRAGADTGLFNTPDGAATREIVVLNAADGQTLPWAIDAGLVDTVHFGPVAPAMRAADGNVYVAERRGRVR